MKFVSGFLFLTVIACANAHSQQLWSSGLESNVDIYKPYTAEAQNANKKVRSYTCGAYADRIILSGKTWNWSSGLALKTILYEIEKFKYIEDVDYYLVDVRSLSVSFGARNEYSRVLFRNNKKMANVGLQSTIYFFEFYDCRLVDQEGRFHSASYNLAISEMPYNFPLSSANMVLFYRHLWGLQKKHTFGFTTSLGTNIYSDWDQFSRYAWIGLGVDFGFGKKLLPDEPQ